jgi:hypothetical protein
MDDDPEGRTFELPGESYVRYQMTYAVRDDLLLCSAVPTYVLEAKYGPTGAEIATATVGLCSRQGRGPLFGSRSTEFVNIVAILPTSAGEKVREVIEGKSAFFASVGLARLCE